MGTRLNFKHRTMRPAPDALTICAVATSFTLPMSPLQPPRFRKILVDGARRGTELGGSERRRVGGRGDIGVGRSAVPAKQGAECGGEDGGTH